MSRLCKHCFEPIETGLYLNKVVIAHVKDPMVKRELPYPHDAEELFAAPEPPVKYRNIKLSLLPVDTVIDGQAKDGYDAIDGMFIKKESEYGTYWEDLYSGCGCCESHVLVADTFDIEAYREKNTRSWITEKEHVDEFFTSYKIIALPPGHVIDPEALHGPAMGEHGPEYQDGTSLFHECNGVNCEAE